MTDRDVLDLPLHELDFDDWDAVRVRLRAAEQVVAAAQKLRDDAALEYEPEDSAMVEDLDDALRAYALLAGVDKPA